MSCSIYIGDEEHFSEEIHMIKEEETKKEGEGSAMLSE